MNEGGKKLKIGDVGNVATFKAGTFNRTLAGTAKYLAPE
jgi:hypothetical protein